MNNNMQRIDFTRLVQEDEFLDLVSDFKHEDIDKDAFVGRLSSMIDVVSKGLETKIVFLSVSFGLCKFLVHPFSSGLFVVEVNGFGKDFGDYSVCAVNFGSTAYLSVLSNMVCVSIEDNSIGYANSLESRDIAEVTITSKFLRENTLFLCKGLLSVIMNSIPSDDSYDCAKLASMRLYNLCFTNNSSLGVLANSRDILDRDYLFSNWFHSLQCQIVLAINKSLLKTGESLYSSLSQMHDKVLFLVSKLCVEDIVSKDEVVEETLDWFRFF